MSSDDETEKGRGSSKSREMILLSQTQRLLSVVQSGSGAEDRAQALRSRDGETADLKGCWIMYKMHIDL